MKNIKTTLPVITMVIAGFFGAASYAASVPVDYDPAANYPDLVWTSEGFRPADGVDLYEGGKFHKSKTLPYYIEGDFVVGENMCYPKKPQQNYVENFDKFYVYTTTRPEESNKNIITNTSGMYTNTINNIINGGKNISIVFPIINCVCVSVDINCDDTTTDTDDNQPGTESESETISPVPLPETGFLLLASLGLLCSVQKKETAPWSLILKKNFQKNPA